jgi:GR25 family glycosyltransferase involved in LPS biosynthesis
MNTLFKTFLSSFEEKDAVAIVRNARCSNFHNINTTLYPFFSKLFYYSFDVLTEIAISAYYAGNIDLSYDISNRILEFKNLSEKQLKATLFNQHFCIDHISNRYIDYPAEKIQKINEQMTQRTEFKEGQVNLITFSITSCKRFDLFEKTMNSFINCCTDLHLISEWLCVDDNSSEEDRQKMKTLYPFFTFYFKTDKEKGHPRSMNIIRNHVKTPFIFHMEDDWKFIREKNFMSQCLEILAQDSNIGQCLINKNYAETGGDIKILGGDFKTTCTGLRYFIHEHCKNNTDITRFTNKHGQGNTCHYWPHFSFRPSLVKTRILQELGEYNESISHFERDYSYRYSSKNYVSAFLEGIDSIHIGRLTSERNDVTKLNAYILNGEAQFEGKEKLEDKITLKSFSSTFKTYIINLDKRPDRWQKFEAAAKQQKLEFLEYERFSAIDGSKLLPTHQLLRMFDGNDFRMRRGMVGVTLSHMKLYIELINSDYDFYFIFEDDVTFTPNFDKKLLHLHEQISKLDWDIVYLGHHLYHPVPEAYHKTRLPIIERWYSKTSLSKSMGGLSSYFISKTGAKKLMEFINIRGMTNGIDTMQQLAADELSVFYTFPHLTYSDCYRGSTRIDSNIQYDYSSLSVNLDERIQDEINFFKSKNIDLIEVTDFEIVKHNIEKEEHTEVFYFKAETDVQKKFLKNVSTYPFYMLETSVFIFVPKHIEGRYFDRLKKDGKFCIDDAINFINESKAT